MSECPLCKDCTEIIQNDDGTYEIWCDDCGYHYVLPKSGDAP
jgi:DNA-directed RNA polymerase subunit RPC12/RpoP